MQWIFTHFPRGLPTSSLFFFAISPLILKGLVPILQHLCRIFRNTPTFSLSDGFQRSYGHCFWDPTFFWSTLYKLWWDNERWKASDGSILAIIVRQIKISWLIFMLTTLWSVINPFSIYLIHNIIHNIRSYFYQLKHFYEGLTFNST